MSVTECAFIESEEVTEVAKGKVSLHVFLLVNDAATQRLLVSLALENLLFYCSSLKYTQGGIVCLDASWYVR